MSAINQLLFLHIEKQITLNSETAFEKIWHLVFNPGPLIHYYYPLSQNKKQKKKQTKQKTKM